MNSIAHTTIGTTSKAWHLKPTGRIGHQEPWTSKLGFSETRGVRPAGKVGDSGVWSVERTAPNAATAQTAMDGAITVLSAKNLSDTRHPHLESV